jgi:YD repeat-containing protein
MKKLFLLLFLPALFCFASSLMLVSCSSDDVPVNYTNNDPTLLKKVIFNDGQPYEKHWNFNADGLLKAITQADGTVIQTFTYDASHNLLSTAGHTFTYDSSNIITTVDGYPVAYSYDAAGGKYTFDYSVPAGEDPADFPHRTEIIVNQDLLLLRKRVFFTNAAGGEFFYEPEKTFYQNGNLVRALHTDAETEQNYEFDSKVNPLKAALLPVCRAMALVEGKSIYGNDPWINGSYSSVNNVAHIAYALEDPESAFVAYEYNGINRPMTQTHYPVSNGEPDGPGVVTAHYYYQGDIVP